MSFWGMNEDQRGFLERRMHELVNLWLASFLFLKFSALKHSAKRIKKLKLYYGFHIAFFKRANMIWKNGRTPF